MKQKKIVVLGGGISGYGSAILAKKLGFATLLSDAGRIADRYKAALDEWGVEYEEGGHTMERILAADEVIKSPGIPEKAPVVKALRAQGTPIISEIEFAGRYKGKARTICITGSNGKTTTTSLTYQILRDAGYNVALGGNIGESFAYSVATGEYDWYVLELSSFQLDGMYDFRADVAVLMNITPDHLDRYDYCFQNYIDSKMRIAQNQHSRCAFIYSADDQVIAEQLPKYDLRMRQLPFAAKTAVASGAGDAYLDGDGIFTATVGKRSVEIDTAKMQIKGLHNAYDAMAASLAALAAGVEPEQVRATVESFGGVEHRLERVKEHDNVLWINDSKATNVDSVWYALESMTRPTVWIAGGTDKGNDYAPLMDFAREKVHTLICMGVDNQKLIDSFTGTIPTIRDTHSLDEAMTAAREAARVGDVVLLSPACASFDLFRNYEARGEEFKQWVNENVK
ncbi:MAG: UDP-N-acetylmuramoyl-L-alanine--D-glutamate ligase [Rikenellaceae bacterium]|nr:UDP-N-acetylmuramoyl-L-alanine--D-glutamate ligase [Rikenellaceae bacterium]